jgi:exonuclease III
MVKWKTYQDELLILNIYDPTARASTFIKETLQRVKAHIVPHTIILEDLNIQISSTDRSCKKKLDRDAVKLTEFISHMDLTDVYRTFHPKTKVYTFFWALHCTFSKIDHIINHKTGLNKYKNIEIIPCTLSDHHELRLVFKNNKYKRKPTYTWKLNNALYSMITWSRKK